MEPNDLQKKKKPSKVYERKKEVALMKTILSLCNEFVARAMDFVFDDTSHVYLFGYEY